MYIKTGQGVKIEPKYSYRPVVSFRTQTGKTIKFSPSISMHPAPYQVGEQVPVLYLPDQPQQAQINQFAYLWFYVLMLIFFGFFALGMGAFGVVMLVI